MHDSLKQQCEQDPAYAQGSAFVRTRILCRVLTEAGQPIPGWMPIRDIIGKGSATDINKGIKAYREEHASLLRAMRGGNAVLPEGLASRVADLWRDAVDEASKLFAADVVLWQERIASATEAVRAMEAERDRHAHAAQELRLVADQLREASASASALLSAEREARAALEVRLEKQSEELLKQQQQFEATSRRAIQEIDAARQDKRRDVERLQSELQKATTLQAELAQSLATAKEDAAAAHALTAELRAQVLTLRQEQAADRKHGKKGRLVPSKLRRSG